MELGMFLSLPVYDSNKKVKFRIKIRSVLFQVRTEYCFVFFIQTKMGSFLFFHFRVRIQISFHFSHSVSDPIYRSWTTMESSESDGGFTVVLLSPFFLLFGFDLFSVAFFPRFSFVRIEEKSVLEYFDIFRLRLFELYHRFLRIFFICGNYAELLRFFLYFSRTV